MPVKRKPTSPEFFNFDEPVLRALADAYGLSDLDSFAPILLDGEYCTLLEVRSETSRKIVIESASRKYFLKQIPWYCDDDERIRFSHSFQMSLSSQGIPVPKVILSSTGQSWVTVDNRKFSLFDYCTGERYSGSHMHLASAARTLAAVHSVAFSYPGIVPEQLFNLAAEHVDLLEQCLTPRPGANGIAFVQAFEKFRSVVLNEFRSQIELARMYCMQHDWNSLPLMGVHGDYSPWNMLFTERGQVSGLLDFDNSDLGPRLHDIAEALVTFCTLTYRQDSTNFANVVPTMPIGDSADHFLSVYNSLSPLMDNEWQCLPWVIRCILIEFFCLGMIRGDYTLDHYPAMLDCLHTEFEFV